MKKILAFGVLAIVLSMGLAAYTFLKTPEEASGPIQAVPLTVETIPAENAGPAGTSAQTEATTGDGLDQGAGETAKNPVFLKKPGFSKEMASASDVATIVEDSSTEEVVADKTVATTLEHPRRGNADPIIFQIIQAESEARFLINEVLRGAPKTVVGVTDQVAGEIAVNPNNPQSAQIGSILVNARTLATDDDFRNRAIKNQILRTNDYEFITFTPTELIGLPENVAIGQSFSFRIVGDLTVTDVTQEVVFEAVVTPVSETRLEGSARTTILYADYNLFIPQARLVTDVANEVIIELNFAAEGT